ncbi:MAG: BolA family transcriptional regulator [Alphaproteobacteria bacterium]|nr:BolA family transcriptional regulator [Alphaproteobacteria bacterium]
MNHDSDNPKNNTSTNDTGAQAITTLLTQHFEAIHIALENQSHLHAGHNEEAKQHNNTHYKLVIVSAQFADLSRVARQRAIFNALGDLFDTTPLHALSISALTPDQAKQKNII